MLLVAASACSHKPTASKQKKTIRALRVSSQRGPYPQ